MKPGPCYPLKKDYYDYVLISQVVEHLLYPERALMEIHKSCKNGAVIRIETAHYTNKGAYNSMQHIHFFHEDAFKNFIDCHTLIDKGKFKIKKLEVTPTNVGKFIPAKIRKKLSLFMNGLQSQIHCEYEVIK